MDKIELITKNMPTATGYELRPASELILT